MIEKLMLMALTLTRPQRKEERGATATEYGLLVALIAMALLVGVGAFGGALNNFFDGLATRVGTWVR